jgi:hypothetical protein
MSLTLGSFQQPIDQGHRQDLVVDKVVRFICVQTDLIF